MAHRQQWETHGSINQSINHRSSLDNIIELHTISHDDVVRRDMPWFDLCRHCILLYVLVMIQSSRLRYRCFAIYIFVRKREMIIHLAPSVPTHIPFAYYIKSIWSTTVWSIAAVVLLFVDVSDDAGECVVSCRVVSCRVVQFEEDRESKKFLEGKGGTNTSFIHGVCDRQRNNDQSFLVWCGAGIPDTEEQGLYFVPTIQARPGVVDALLLLILLLSLFGCSIVTCLTCFGVCVCVCVSVSIYLCIYTYPYLSIGDDDRIWHTVIYPVR